MFIHLLYCTRNKQNKWTCVNVWDYLENESEKNLGLSFGDSNFRDD